MTRGFAFTNSEQYFEQELTLVGLPWQALVGLPWQAYRGSFILLFHRKATLKLFGKS